MLMPHRFELNRAFNQRSYFRSLKVAQIEKMPCHDYRYSADPNKKHRPALKPVCELDKFQSLTDRIAQNIPKCATEPVTMKNNIGMDSIVFVRDASNATRAAFAFSSSEA